MALNPQLLILTIPRQEAGDLMEHRDGSPYLEGILFRWAEYHPWRFRQRLVQHRLGTFNLCCRMAALLEKPEYQPMTGVGGDQGDLQDSDLDSVRMKAYW